MGSSEAMMLRRRMRRAVLAIIGVFTLKIFLMDMTRSPVSSSSSLWGRSGRRYLQGTDAIYPWARKHLRPLDAVPEPKKETAVFWHIPKVKGSPQAIVVI